MDSTQRTDETVPVLVVGGGLVGLATAAFLALRGVRCLVVDKRSGTSGQPRSRGINPRTVELLRELSLEERLRATPSAVALRDNSGIIAMETLAGRELGAMSDRYVADVDADLSHLTPATWCLCHQAETEPLLLERARELGAKVLFGTELVDHTQDVDTVRATLRDCSTGAEHTVAARYLVAADGAASGVRDRLGIASAGPGVLGHFLNIHFRADLTAELAGRKFVMAYTFRPLRTGLMPLDNAAEWLLHVMFDPEREPVESFTGARCTELVRLVSGVDELPVTILGARPWAAAAAVATTFRRGRIFLVGDAAHVMPPSGAFGSNTGVADAHNLAWKLALVLDGSAADGLLDTYDAERRPVAEATVRQSVLRSNDRPRMAGEQPPPPDPAIVADPLVWFGCRVASAAVRTEPGCDGQWPDGLDGSPGTRVPHLTLPDGCSTGDLVGPGFALLSGPGDTGWAAAAATAALRCGVAVDNYPVGDPAGWSRAFGVGPDGAVLVRPDGIVAWRTDSPAAVAGAEPAAVIAAALAGPDRARV